MTKKASWEAEFYVEKGRHEDAVTNTFSTSVVNEYVEPSKRGWQDIRRAVVEHLHAGMASNGTASREDHNGERRGCI